MDITQPLVVQNVPARGQTTAYVANGAGQLIAYAPNGYVRWQRSLGTAPNSCPQLDQYGITGTPVVDAETRAIYAVDAFGLLHALDLATGAERPGWPVRIYDDPQNELVWDALADIQGSIYVGTGSFCDRPDGRQVDPRQARDRRVSRFLPVPKALGGGGSIWASAARHTARDRTRSSSSRATHSREERTPGPPSTSPQAMASTSSSSRAT